ncbi:MAG: transglutaminase, partial [Candidatus Accumulibacter phosphatis]|nr:transglutaminase [Candidatus Accumulibacter phosphatis]
MTPANLPASRYHVVHETIYRYESPVSLSRQMLHLTPRDCHWQRCLSHQITVAPE